MVARQISIDAYHKKFEILSSKRREVYQYILFNPGCTRRQISKQLTMETSSVSGRVNELLRQGLVMEGNKVLDSYTNVAVSTLYPYHFI